MARKSTYAREDVVSAALAVVERHGLAGLTARRVGEELEASTEPVYSNFVSMDQLTVALLEEACARLLEYCRRPWTEDAFLNMGVGYLRFAADQPALFKALYFLPHRDFAVDDRVGAVLLADLDAVPYLAPLPAAIKEELLFQAGVYSHGLATLICTGQWREPDLDQAVDWLRSVGGLQVRAAFEAAGQVPCADIELRFGAFTIPWRTSGGDSRGEEPDA